MRGSAARNGMTAHRTGTKASNRKVEEEKIIENVISKLMEGLVVAKAITDLSSIPSSFLMNDKESDMYQNVDTQLYNLYQ